MTQWLIPRRGWASLACLAVTLIVFGCSGAPTQRGTAKVDAPAKTDLQILLVTHDPAAPKPPFQDLAKERTIELYKERSTAWEQLLRKHFRDVTVVYGADYHVDLSAKADVTIFDARPTPLRESSRGVEPKTGEPTYMPPLYIPESFDHAALMISENSPLIGEPIGLKLDWM